MSLPLDRSLLQREEKRTAAMARKTRFWARKARFLSFVGEILFLVFATRGQSVGEI
jgi:hypothetical protein